MPSIRQTRRASVAVLLAAPLLAAMAARAPWGAHKLQLTLGARRYTVTNAATTAGALPGANPGFTEWTYTTPWLWSVGAASPPPSPPAREPATLALVSVGTLPAAGLAPARRSHV